MRRRYPMGVQSGRLRGFHGGRVCRDLYPYWGPLGSFPGSRRLRDCYNLLTRPAATADEIEVQLDRVILERNRISPQS